MEEKTIYDLKLHEILRVDTEYVYWVVTRVPGGWLYRPSGNEEFIFIFVPWNNDLQPRKDHLDLPH